MSIADGWDKDGKPNSFRKMETNDFKNAAQTMSSTFGIFLTGLKTWIGDASDEIGEIIEDLTDAGIDKLMMSIGSFIDPILNLAAGKVKVGDEVLNITKDDMLKGTDILISMFKTVLTPMNEYAELIGDGGMFSDSPVKKVCDALGMIIGCVKGLSDISTGEKPLSEVALDFQKGCITIFSILKHPNTPAEKESDMFADSMEYVNKGFGYLIESIQGINKALNGVDFVDFANNFTMGTATMLSLITNQHLASKALGDFEDNMDTFTSGLEPMIDLLSDILEISNIEKVGEIG